MNIPTSVIPFKPFYPIVTSRDNGWLWKIGSNPVTYGIFLDCTTILNVGTGQRTLTVGTLKKVQLPLQYPLDDSLFYPYSPHILQVRDIKTNFIHIT